jgi:tetratricopeptide (TPR) repeat protein
MDKQIRDADFVLMVCTETYYSRVMGEEEPGKGLGVRWEGNLIYQHIYNPGTVNHRFIPVLLESGELAHIPAPVQGASYYFAQTEEGYEELYRRLTKQPEHKKPELGKVRVLGEAQKLPSLEPKERKQNFFAASLTNLPFERNPFFTGREQIMNDLHAGFSRGATQALSGLGGLGKTQTAIEFAYRYRDDYQAVFWVRADSQLGLSSGFVEIARTLNLPEKDAQNPDDSVNAVNHWLNNNSQWLLIFDNADLPELLKGFRPRNAKGHILLTSRAQVFDTLGIAKPFEIDVMLPEEALEFLFARTGRDKGNAAEREAAVQLVEELGYLPLALEQAAAFISAKKARFQDYLAGYRKRRLQLLQESLPVTGDYPESVATTWAINFREVEEESEASSDLLRTSAFLSPDRIPLELITNGNSQLGEAISAALVEVDDNPLVLNEVLEPLTRYSFIRLDNDSQTYSIHRLVQVVLNDGMDAHTQRLYAERTVRALDLAFPGVDFGNWQLCGRLLPHAKAVAKFIEKWDFTFDQGARLLNQAAFYSKVRGQYADAESLYKQSLTIREKALSASDPALALSLNNLAVLYESQGKYAEAEELHKRSLTIRETALGPEHSDTANSLNNLAAVYDAQGKYSEAEPLYKRSLTITEKALGPEHPDVALGLNNLASLYHSQEKYAEAEPLYERSLTIREKVQGPEHPDVALGLNNLAELYREQGKYDEAEALFKRSLAIRERVLGPNHRDVATSFNNLAALYRARGRNAEAEPLLNLSLVIFENALGPNHPNVAVVLGNYALLLRETHRDSEAARMEARAALIRAKYAHQDSEE